ncbi:MAG: UDP-N-acetylmuramoyl-tripeptide--D-alanyl-D-alanine ligase [Phycisphaerales bacterium]|nr:UDP-N-acetylmuramoyl-tripeptide--D-alanyl-D-alanine ligase [Phycisphaerales bacterium]
MKPLTLEEVVSAMQGTCDRAAPLGNVLRVSTDTRDTEPGDLFVAITGERFDGHDFVDRAAAGGAIAAVVRNDYAPKPVRGPSGKRIPPSRPAFLIRVDDTVKALGRLARYYRRSVLAGSVTVVAVTGSNGKTTTKSMIAHILAGRWTGKASLKSFNNAIGVPLTLLSSDAKDKFVICEVGTNHLGEIAELAYLVEPEVAVITGVSEAHLAGLGSLENIAGEKLSLLRFLRGEGCGIVNADQEVIRDTIHRDRELSQQKLVYFGCWPEADLRLTALRVEQMDTGVAGMPGLVFEVNDRFAYRLPVPGRHNGMNALAAVAVARRFGMDHEEIAERLASFTMPAMRLNGERIGSLTLINDAYNANPASLAAAVEVLADIPARRRVLIVGDMRELGDDTQRLHREAAIRIARSEPDVVIAVGENADLIGQTIRDEADKIETHVYSTTTLARKRLISHLSKDDTVLIKGSRALALEQLAEKIKEWAVER